MRKLDARQVAREKSAFRYSSALERGDFSTVEIILQEAEHDSLLAQMLAEINMVYEHELIRLSPSHTRLNHSTNHYRKDLLMTTITLPAPQRSAQRWLPFTLVAACLSVLFIAALLMRPTPDGGWLASLQGRASETPTALPTLVPTVTATLFPAAISVGTVQPPTVVPPADLIGVVQPTLVAQQGICKIYNPTGNAITLYAAPLTKNSLAAVVGELAPNESAVILYQEYDPASAPIAATWFLMMTNGENSAQVTGWASANSLEPLGLACAPMPMTASVDMIVTATPMPMSSTVMEATSTPFPMTNPNDAADVVAPVPSVAIAVPTVVMPVEVSLPELCRVNNQSPDPLTIFAAPLTLNSDAAVIGQLAPNAEAVVLSRNLDPQSAAFAAPWYLIMTTDAGQQQVTGWVSANSTQGWLVNCEPTRPVVVGDVPVLAAVLPPTTVPPMPAPAGTPTAYFDDVMRNPAPVIVVLDEFAGIPANTEVRIVSAMYDGMQWVYQIQSADGITVSIRQDDLIRITAVGSTTAPVAEGMCQAVNMGRESVPVYSEPSRDESQSILVNNLAPNIPAKVLYQQFDRTTGENWFLILAVQPEGKQVSGWVSIDTVSLIGMGCPSAKP